MIKYVDWEEAAFTQSEANGTVPPQNLMDCSESTFAGNQAPVWTRKGVDAHSSLLAQAPAKKGAAVTSAQLNQLAIAANETRAKIIKKLIRNGHAIKARPPPIGVGSDVLS